MASRSTLTILIVIGGAVAALSFGLFEPHRAVVSCLLGWTVLAIAVYDAENLIIPDVLSLPLIPTGLIVVWLLDGGEPVQTHIAAAVAGGGLLYVVRQIYYLWRGREGLGLGDVKLGAAAGAWTGLQGMSNVLLLACVLAILGVALTALFKKASVTGMTAIPFGTFLGPSIWVIWAIESVAEADPVGFFGTPT